MELDDFIATYLVMLAVGSIMFVLFWGAVIFFVVKFFRSNNGMTTQQKLEIASRVMGAYSGRGGAGEPGPNESAARSTLIENGIDPNR
jgi:hypothetical protein